MCFVRTRDMAAASLTITSQRSEVVDFTYPFWFEYSSAAIKVDKNRSILLVYVLEE